MEDPGVYGRIILKWILQKWVECMDWIDLPQDRDRWLALVKAVMNFRVPKKCGEFLEWLELASHEGLCSMELVKIKIIAAAYHKHVLSKDSIVRLMNANIARRRLEKQWPRDLLLPATGLTQTCGL